MRGGIVAVLSWLSVTVAIVQIGLPAASARAQTWQTDQVMQQKLAHSERLLAALVTSNWSALEQHGRALQDVTTQPGWDVMRLPEFNRHTTDFQRATESLVEAAAERDTDGTVAAYNRLVTSCVACHRYVARARIAERRF